MSDTLEELKLEAKAVQGGFDVTNKMSYLWERYSSNPTEDATYNEVVLKSNRSPVVAIKQRDLVDKQATFLCRAYNSDGELVATNGADVRYVVQAKSAYQIWLDAGNRGTEQEFLKSLKGEKGDKGDQGVPGAVGADGRTQYTHIAYADSTQGDNFSVSDPNDRAYMGTYVDFEPTDSVDPTRYKWVRIKGNDGAKGEAGEKGDAGKSLVVHKAYASGLRGENFSLTDPVGRAYIGTAYTHDATPPNNYADYSWEKRTDNLERETVEALNNVLGEIQKVRQEQEALASRQALSEFQSALNAFRASQASDRAAAEQRLTNALSALAMLENNLKDMAERWNFLDIFMQASNDGFVIGNPTKGTYILLKDDRIGLFSNGEEVGTIAGSSLEFTQSIFSERAQISEWMFSAYENNSKIFVLRYVGSSSK